MLSAPEKQRASYIAFQGKMLAWSGRKRFQVSSARGRGHPNEGPLKIRGIVKYGKNIKKGYWEMGCQALTPPIILN